MVADYFVILPLVYTIYISFTKYSSSYLLSYERSLGLLHQDTYTIEGAAEYKYKLHLQEDGKYIMYLESEKDETQRLVSEPFSLTPDENASSQAEPVKMTHLLLSSIKATLSGVANLFGTLRIDNSSGAGLFSLSGAPHSAVPYESAPRFRPSARGQSSSSKSARGQIEVSSILRTGRRE